VRKYRRGDSWGIDRFANGKRLRYIVGTEEEADRELARLRAELASGAQPSDPKRKGLIFDNLCAEYLEYSKANKKPQSHRRDQVSIKSLLDTFAQKLVVKITAYDLEHYKTKRLLHVKPATVNRELSCIKHMFNLAVVWEKIKSHNLHKVKKFKEPDGRVRYLSDDEIPRVLAACSRYLRPIVIMALNTGMRKGEILNLKWTEVDMNNKLIIIIDAKNNKSRSIPINPVLFNELVVKKSKANSEYVFAHHDGTRFHELYYGFMSALKKVDINNFHFHDLRHTFASRLAMSGIDIRIIQELMGHKTITMTMRYSHLSSKTLREAVDRLCRPEDIKPGNSGADAQNSSTTIA